MKHGKWSMYLYYYTSKYVVNPTRVYATRIWLRARNHFSNDRATGSVPVILSMTTHGKRVERVWLALESIARGRLRPCRIILWLDRSLVSKELSPRLARLAERGVEFRYVDDVGPHQKYYYALNEAILMGIPLATVDDDCLYWSWWLERLFNEHLHTPQMIVCYRARKFLLGQDKKPAPYREWPFVDFAHPDIRVFFTGVSGVIYPVEFLRKVADRGDAFKNCCPKADDIWLNYIATKTETPARQALPFSWGFPEIRTRQSTALWSNNEGGGNDEQIMNTYDADTIELIAQQEHEDLEV